MPELKPKDIDWKSKDPDKFARLERAEESVRNDTFVVLPAHQALLNEASEKGRYWGLPFHGFESLRKSLLRVHTPEDLERLSAVAKELLKEAQEHDAFGPHKRPAAKWVVEEEAKAAAPAETPPAVDPFWPEGGQKPPAQEPPPPLKRAPRGR